MKNKRKHTSLIILTRFFNSQKKIYSTERNIQMLVYYLQIKTIDDIKEIPILTREEIREKLEKFTGTFLEEIEGYSVGRFVFKIQNKNDKFIK